MCPLELPAGAPKKNKKYPLTIHKVTPATYSDNTTVSIHAPATSPALSEVLKQAATGLHMLSLPDYVIVVPQVKFLLVLPGVVHNSHTGHEIDYLLGGGVVQVVAALMSPVSVHPLQSQVAVGSSSVSHGRTSACVSPGRCRVGFSDPVSFTKKGFILSPCVPLVPSDRHQPGESVEIRHF